MPANISMWAALKRATQQSSDNIHQGNHKNRQELTCARLDWTSNGIRLRHSTSFYNEAEIEDQ